MDSFAVCFTYSFDHDAAVYSFDNENEAKDFLKNSYSFQMQSAQRDEQRHTGTLADDGLYAKISMEFEDEDDDVTEIRVARIYQ